MAIFIGAIFVGALITTVLFFTIIKPKIIAIIFRIPQITNGYCQPNWAAMKPVVINAIKTPESPKLLWMPIELSRLFP